MPRPKKTSSVRKQKSRSKSRTKKRASVRKSASRAKTRTINKATKSTGGASRFVRGLSEHAMRAGVGAAAATAGYKLGTHLLANSSPYTAAVRLGGAGLNAYRGNLGAAAAGVTGAISAITGHGDYNIQQNSILHGSQIPAFKGRHGTRVRHREYICDIKSQTTFNLTSFPINPGAMITTSADASLVGLPVFPWLSTIAGSFEEYKFYGLVFEFRSTASNSVGSTNLALGTVAMGTEYNSTLNNYQTKLQMENSEFSSSCNVVDSMMHPIECKKSETVLGELYIRQFANAVNQDLRLYDLGNFQVAVTGCQAANNIIGELWASYDLELFKAKVGPAGGLSIAAGHYTASAGISTSAYFGNNGSMKSTAGLVLNVSTTTVTFGTGWPLGYYEVTYIVVGSGAVTVKPTITTTTNCQTLNLLVADGSAGFGADGNGGSATLMAVTQFFELTGDHAVLTWSGGTMPGSPTSMDLYITQLNPYVTT